MTELQPFDVGVSKVNLEKKTDLKFSEGFKAKSPSNITSFHIRNKCKVYYYYFFTSKQKHSSKKNK